MSLVLSFFLDEKSLLRAITVISAVSARSSRHKNFTFLHQIDV
jgi:hypothetical protein